MGQSLERKFDLRHFRAISNAIATYEDFNLLVNHLAEGLCRTFKVKGASIMILEETEKQLFRVSSFGISETYLEKGPVFADPEKCALYTGKPEVIHDLCSDERAQYPECAAREGIVSMVSIPIRFRTAIIGVIRIYSGERLTLNDEDIDSLCVLANQLGVVIECNGLKNFADQIKTAIDRLPSRVHEPC